MGHEKEHYGLANWSSIIMLHDVLLVKPDCTNKGHHLSKYQNEFATFDPNMHYWSSR